MVEVGEKQRIFERSQIGKTASASALHCGPWAAITCSLSMSWRASWMARALSPSVSLVTIRSFLPEMPPAALISSTATSVAARLWTP